MQLWKFLADGPAVTAEWTMIVQHTGALQQVLVDQSQSCLLVQNRLVSYCGSLVKIAFLCLVCVERGAAEYDLKPLHSRAQ